MSVIEAMARAYLEALAPGGFRDTEELDAAVRRRIKPMRAALAAAEALGWKLVPVEPSERMLATETEYGTPLNGYLDNTSALSVYRAMIAASPSIEENKP